MAVPNLRKQELLWVARALSIELEANVTKAVILQSIRRVMVELPPAAASPAGGTKKDDDEDKKDSDGEKSGDDQEPEGEQEVETKITKNYYYQVPTFKYNTVGAAAASSADVPDDGKKDEEEDEEEEEDDLEELKQVASEYLDTLTDGDRRRLYNALMERDLLDASGRYPGPAAAAAADASGDDPDDGKKGGDSQDNNKDRQQDKGEEDIEEDLDEFDCVYVLADGRLTSLKITSTDTVRDHFLDSVKVMAFFPYQRRLRTLAPNSPLDNYKGEPFEYLYVVPRTWVDLSNATLMIPLRDRATMRELDDPYTRPAVGASGRLPGPLDREGEAATFLQKWWRNKRSARAEELIEIYIKVMDNITPSSFHTLKATDTVATLLERINLDVSMIAYLTCNNQRLPTDLVLGSLVPGGLPRTATIRVYLKTAGLHGGGRNKRPRDEQPDKQCNNQTDEDETDFYDEDGVRSDASGRLPGPSAGDSNKPGREQRTGTALLHQSFAEVAAVAKAQPAYTDTDTYKKLFEGENAKLKMIAESLRLPRSSNDIFRELLKDLSIQDLRHIQAEIHKFKSMRNNRGHIQRKLFASMMPEEFGQVSSKKDLAVMTMNFTKELLWAAYVKQFGNNGDAASSAACEWINEYIIVASMDAGRRQQSVSYWFKGLFKK